MVRLFFIAAVLLPLQFAFLIQARAQVDRFTSEEHPPAICNTDQFVKIAKCHGDYCDNFGLTCQKIPGVKWGADALFLPYISDTNSLDATTWRGPTAARCPDGHAVAGWSCRGRNCDEISVLCVRLQGRGLSACRRPSRGMSDRDIDGLDVGAFRVATGFICSGRFCQYKNFETCNIDRPFGEGLHLIVNGAPETLGGKCLEAAADRNRADVRIWECARLRSQGWVLMDTGEIMNNTGRCLNVHAPDMRRNGGRVQLWDCNGDPSSTWTMTSNGMIVNAGGKCLGVTSAEINRNGALLRVWDCSGRPEQQWRILRRPG